MAIYPPRTINGVREALPADRREAFTTAVNEAPAERLPQLIADWSAVAMFLADPDIVEKMTSPVDLENAPDLAEYCLKLTA